MKTLLRVAALAAAAIGMSAPALADISVKDATGASIATCSTTVGSTQVPCHQVKNSSGTTIDPATLQSQTANTTAITNAQATAGSSASAPFGVQGVAGGVALPTNSVPLRTLTTTDIGAAVAANTATQLTAASATRFSYSIQNQTAGTCWFNTLAAATADFHDHSIPPGGLFESSPTHVGTGAISVICTVAGNVSARQTNQP